MSKEIFWGRRKMILDKNLDPHKGMENAGNYLEK